MAECGERSIAGVIRPVIGRSVARGSTSVAQLIPLGTSSHRAQQPMRRDSLKAVTIDKPREATARTRGAYVRMALSVRQTGHNRQLPARSAVSGGQTPARPRRRPAAGLPRPTPRQASRAPSRSTMPPQAAKAARALPPLSSSSLPRPRGAWAPPARPPRRRLACARAVTSGRRGSSRQEDAGVREVVQQRVEPAQRARPLRLRVPPHHLAVRHHPPGRPPPLRARAARRQGVQLA